MEDRKIRNMLVISNSVLIAASVVLLALAVASYLMVMPELKDLTSQAVRQMLQQARPAQ